MIEMNQLKLPCGSGKNEIENKIRKVLRLAEGEKFSWNIARHSVDARKKSELTDIYTLRIWLGGGKSQEERAVRKSKDRNTTLAEPIVYHFPESEAEASPLLKRPVIIGFGPAGIFCALLLAEHGYRPIVIERGRTIEQRTRDVECFWKTGELDQRSNIQFGEGGAGTYSDGKLNTNVKDKSGRNEYVLKRFVEAGAEEDITYEYHPHIGTDRLRRVIVNLRRTIQEAGGEIFFETEMTGLCIKNRQITGIEITRADGNRAVIETDTVVLAPGHSARNTIRTLFAQSVPMKSKNFAVGFRVSHPQEMINKCQYGVSDPQIMKKLGLETASYKLTAETQRGRGVYSFCMCPGGFIVNASSESGRLAVNGMSDHARDSKRANSAIIMTVSPEDFGSKHELAGMIFQEKLEEKAYQLAEGRIPVESFSDFEAGFSGSLEKNESKNLTEQETEDLCLKGLSTYAPLHTLLPKELTEDFIEGMHIFDRKIKGYAGDDTYICGLESRTSSPVRMIRNEHFQSEIQGLYPCGEGAGYAGGITSAAIDGIKIAEEIAKYHLPPV